MSTKREVLSMLEQNCGTAVSGQEMAETIGVSRTAVWKAIKALEAEGYEIKAVTNLGYRLMNTDILNAEGIAANMTHRVPVKTFMEIDSTNAEAKRMIAAGAEHGTVIAADSQTAGRGRFGKSFYSPKGTGLYLSVILKPDSTHISDAQMITVAAAVVTARAIESLTGRHVDIKWVNDLFLEGKKVCGILTEAVSDFESGRVDSIVVGIGINCSTAAFPTEIQGVAGSLGTDTLSRNRLAAMVADGLIDAFANLNDPAIIDDYRNRSIITGKEITYTEKGRERTAVVESINDRGNLVVRDNTGKVSVISSGEVSIKRW